MIGASSKWNRPAAEELGAFGERIRTGMAKAHAMIGHRMALTRIPLALRTNPDGWPAPKSFPRAYRGGGQPLRDSGRLARAIGYKATAQNVTIGTNVIYAKILQKGGTITPRNAKWLIMPLAPPLSISEVRAFPRGKSAIQARYPGSFWLTKGPEGPGIYRTIRGKAGTKSRKYGDRRKGQISASWERHEHEGKTIERIAAGMKKIKVHKYNWLRFRPTDIQDAREQLLEWVKTGHLPGVALIGGNPNGVAANAR